MQIVYVTIIRNRWACYLHPKEFKCRPSVFTGNLLLDWEGKDQGRSCMADLEWWCEGSWPYFYFFPYWFLIGFVNPTLVTSKSPMLNSINITQKNLLPSLSFNKQVHKPPNPPPVEDVMAMVHILKFLFYSNLTSDTTLLLHSRMIHFISFSLLST